MRDILDVFGPLAAAAVIAFVLMVVVGIPAPLAATLSGIGFVVTALTLGLWWYSADRRREARR